MTKIFFELENLAADGRLLDPVRHVPYCRADPAMFRYVEEKLKVVDVHGPEDSEIGWMPAIRVLIPKVAKGHGVG